MSRFSSTGSLSVIGFSWIHPWMATSSRGRFLIVAIMSGCSRAATAGIYQEIGMPCLSASFITRGMPVNGAYSPTEIPTGLLSPRFS